MTERLLQFIWQHQYFNAHDLRSETGELVQIIYPGVYNTNQGPDFLSARIRVADTLLAGSVELHIRSGDWYRHDHDSDAHYQNVILHVVWTDEGLTVRNVPTLVLEHRISRMLLDQYDSWLKRSTFIPCGKGPLLLDQLPWSSWLDALAAGRLERKSDYVLQVVAQSGQHWEEAFWRLLSRSFGMPLNSDAFEAVAMSLPLNIIVKHRNQAVAVESMLLGQAGLLDADFEDSYAQLLSREYGFYKTKYGFRKVYTKTRALRMRPAGFPSVRLAQLAALMKGFPGLFSKIIETESKEELMAQLNVCANGYWNTHYSPDQPSVYREKWIGPAMADNLLINLIAPVVHAWGRSRSEGKFAEKACRWMRETGAEQNSIIAGWTEMGTDAGSAWETQALIELKTKYCDGRRCLDCAVGTRLLRPDG